MASSCFQCSQNIKGLDMENGMDILPRWRSSPVGNFWEDVKTKKQKKVPLWPRWQEASSRKQLHLGPAGAAGIGCGAGIGFGLVGGAGYGAWPWNNLRWVFGIGFGCGLGMGYGFGQGIGILWDRKHAKPPNKKVVVIEL